MKLEFNRLTFVLTVSLLLGLSASTFISNGVFQSYASSTGRNLLQSKKPCPVNFEYMNYTIITDRCKGPRFPPKECCQAFKDFACPYAEQINDLTTECATVMFSYINLYGKYPPGLFSLECKGGKEGLECPALSPSASKLVKDKNAGHVRYSNPSHSLILSSMLIAFFKLLL